jgi:hypothetical protein
MSPSLISLVLVGALLGSTIVAPSLCNGLVRSQVIGISTTAILLLILAGKLAGLRRGPEENPKG